MTGKNQRGITVLEVIGLVMVAGVIAAILFPVFAKSPHRRHGHASCQSNEKQLGMAMQEYHEDYDGFYPSGTRTSVVNRNSLSYSRSELAGVGWGGQLYGYTKSTSLFACPTDWQSDDPKAKTVISYAMNAHLARGRVKGAGLTAPSHTVVLFEIANAHADVTQWDEGASNGAHEFSPAGNGTTEFLDNGAKASEIAYATGAIGKRPYLDGTWPTARHQDGAVYLFADGHATWFHPDAVSTGDDAAHPKDAQTGGFSGRAAGTANGAYTATFSTI